ncbi:MAG TPA: cytochrome b/b6 domain-containing protein [Candidatus Acidoferrum sp.]|nr:cytochrome b/b6 domain-containing protein [Candidatus Acidoferrum sp.]
MRSQQRLASFPPTAALSSPSLGLDGAESGAAPRSEVKVWDPLVRIFHWGLVAAFLTAWATGDEIRSVHIAAGSCVIGLVAFRIAWGFIGGQHARFTNFVRGPRAVTRYLRDTVMLRARRYLGHNPAGGAMIIALLAMLSVIGATGIMMTTDAFRGLAWIRDLHEGAVSLTLGLVVLHILGVIIASYEHGENLIRAMVTGRKRAESERR